MTSFCRAGFMLILSTLLHPSGLKASEPAPIRIGMPLAVEPYAFPNKDSGLEVELIAAAFQSQGRKTVFDYLPHNRLIQFLNRGLLQVSTSAKLTEDYRGVFSSWPVTNFHNLVITLKTRFPTLSSISELGGMKIVAFQRASEYLGEDFRRMAHSNPQYTEYGGYLPSTMLLVGRTDAVISEPNIFRFWMHKNSKNPLEDEQKLAFHNLLGPGNQYWFAFTTPDVRDLFEKGVAQIYKDGTADTVFDKYFKKYGVDRRFFLELDCRFLKTPPDTCKTRNIRSLLK